MQLSQITPLILSWNEEANIRETLERLAWAERVVLIDSGSTDRTCVIAQEFRNVKVISRTFDRHADQWNFGVDQVMTEWVLSLDSDYRVTMECSEEMRSLADDSNLVGYFVPLIYCVYGEPIRGNILPPRLALFRKSVGRYEQDGHTQVYVPNGKTGTLSAGIWHDDQKPLERWLEAQIRYARLEVEKLGASKQDDLAIADRVRTWIVVAPIVVPMIVLAKGAVFSGWRGLFYALQRMLAEVILSLCIVERKIIGRTGK